MSELSKRIADRLTDGEWFLGHDEVRDLVAEHAALEAEVRRLQERLTAAEAMCLMYGWSAASGQTDREKAAASRCRRLPRMYAGGVDRWDKPASDVYAERRQP